MGLKDLLTSGKDGIVGSFTEYVQGVDKVGPRRPRISTRAP